MALFIRTHNRTAEEIFQNMILPRAQMLVYSLSQKWVNHCRRNHVWKNRTGALENSISWVGPERTAAGYRAEIQAGGTSRAKYSYDYSARTEAGIQKRNPVKRGQSVFVNYAAAVEAKGYPVLSQGAELIRKIAPGMGLTIMRLPAE